MNTHEHFKLNYPHRVLMLFPGAIVYPRTTDNLSLRQGTSPFELLVKHVQETMQAAALALGYLPEFEGKTLQVEDRADF